MSKFQGKFVTAPSPGGINGRTSSLPGFLEIFSLCVTGADLLFCASWVSWFSLGASSAPHWWGVGGGLWAPVEHLGYRKDPSLEKRKKKKIHTHKKKISVHVRGSWRHPKVTGVKTHQSQEVLWRQGATWCVSQGTGHNAAAVPPGPHLHFTLSKSLCPL